MIEIFNEGYSSTKIIGLQRVINKHNLVHYGNDNAGAYPHFLGNDEVTSSFFYPDH